MSRAYLLAAAGLVAPLALSGLLAGCSQAPPPETPGPEPVPVLEPMPAAEEEAAAGEEGEPEIEEGAPAEADIGRNKGEPPEAEPPPRAETAPDRGDATVISVARPEAKPRTLWEAAVAARAQRAETSDARISVTDENLHEFQGAELTFAEPGPKRSSDAGEAGEGSESEAGEVRGEEYWRSRVRDLRLRLRAAVDELAELEEQAAGLRRSFYAADDPYVRDSEIKPAWDRSLDRIGALRREIGDVTQELADTLEEGRQAGALPGWLREGVELEPEPEELPRRGERNHEPGEPSVMEIEETPPAP